MKGIVCEEGQDLVIRREDGTLVRRTSIITDRSETTLLRGRNLSYITYHLDGRFRFRKYDQQSLRIIDREDVEIPPHDEAGSEGFIPAVAYSPFADYIDKPVRINIKKQKGNLGQVQRQRIHNTGVSTAPRFGVKLEN